MISLLRSVKCSANSISSPLCPKYWSRLDVSGLFLSPGSRGECCNSDNGNLVGALRVIVDDLQMTKC